MKQTMSHKLSRREALKAGAVVGLGVAATLVPMSVLANVLPKVAICDIRFDGAQEFFSQCRERGIEVINITHDIDEAWMSIRSRWRTAPFPLVGLTQPSAQVVFAELGRSNGLRLDSIEIINAPSHLGRGTGTPVSAKWMSWALIPTVV
jgi:hypothetical protein